MKRILSLLLLVPLPLLAQQGSPPVGQVASSKASVDGLAFPSGTTVLDGSRVVTGLQAATIHLNNGRTVRVNANSTALFTKQQDGGIQIVAERGTVSVRNPDGSTSMIALSQQPEAAAKGAKTPSSKSPESEPGVVAVVYSQKEAKRAEAGTSVIPVNDPTRVEKTGAALLKTNLERKKKPEQFCQEVVCNIRSADCCVVKTGELLSNSFDPDDFVVQQTPALENRVYTQLRGSTLGGAKLLSVVDSKAINPLAPIVIESADGRFREPACVKSTKENLPDDLSKIVAKRTLDTPNLPESLVKLKDGLRHDYGRGANIIQGRLFSDERVVGKLPGNLEPGAKFIGVEDASAIDPLQQIMLKSPDGKRLEAYCIGSIEIEKTDRGNNPGRITLVDGLDNGFVEGSELIQGKSSQEMAAAGRSIQRMANCSCCSPTPPPGIFAWDGALPYIVGGAAGGAAVGTIIAVQQEEESVSPIRPRE